MSSIEDKIRKIKAILEDKSAPDGEKNAALELMEKLQKKYDIEPDKIETKKEWRHIKCTDDYERQLLIRLLDSYRLAAHIKKRHSKNLILFQAEECDYEIIRAELKYHSYVLNKYLKSVTVNYLHKFIMPYKIPGNFTVKDDPVTREAAEAASTLFSGKNYTAKKLIN